MRTYREDTNLGVFVRDALRDLGIKNPSDDDVQTAFNIFVKMLGDGFEKAKKKPHEKKS